MSSATSELPSMSSDITTLAVALCSDANYYEGLETALASIVKSSHTELKSFMFGVIDGGITAEQRTKLHTLIEKLESKYNTPIDIQWQTVDDKSLELLKGLKGSFTYYARLFLPQLFPDQRWMLWVDSDIFCMKNMADLSDHLDETTPLFGAIDPPNPALSKETPHAKKLNANRFDLSSPYINTGVSLINLDLWRKNNLTHLLLEWAHQHREYLVFYDQSIINWTLSNQLGVIPPQYNVIGSQPEAILNMHATPINYHFAGSYKPWLLNFEISFKLAPLAFCRVVGTYEYLKFRSHELDDHDPARLEKLRQATEELYNFLRKPSNNFMCRFKIFLYQIQRNKKRTKIWKDNYTFYTTYSTRTKAMLKKILEDTKSGGFPSS